MFRIVLFSIVAYIECATYPYQYDSTNRYPSSTISSLYTNFPYKTGSYGTDVGNFPEVTRYPNYSPSHGYSSYSTSRYPNYSTNYNNGYSTSGYNSLYGPESSNVNYNQNNYNLQRYGAGYGQGVNGNYNTGYGTSGYGTPGYGTPGYGTPGYGSSGYGMSGHGTPGYGSNLGLGLGTGLGSGLGTGYGTVGYGSVGYGSGLGNGYGNGYGTGYGTGGYTSYEAPFIRDIGSCVNRSPQTGIWVDSLMGMWYGVELIQHLGADPWFDRTESCIVIHISEPMERVRKHP